MINPVKVVQGGNQLAFDSTELVVNTVERMHETIAQGPLAWTSRSLRPARAHGWIASSVYQSIRGVNSALRGGNRLLFELIPGGRASADYSPAETSAIASLNGVFGDHLEASGNPLALPMTLHANGAPLALNSDALADALPYAGPNPVIFLHGLCLSELSWSRNGSPSLGDRLESELGFTPLYLRYNTGRHISTNGREFNRLLERLCASWPVPLDSVTLIGHSMGGLVIRSACWYAEREQRAWLNRLKRVVCLGTPHHGSPLERAGHAFDVTIRKIPYLAPLAFGRHRSAGIKDLSHGDLLDEDWQGHRAHQHRKDKRTPVPLLDGVDYYFVAASLGRHGEDPRGHLFGDLLVRLDSALGSHPTPGKTLGVKPENCRVYHEKNHFDLLDDARVHEQILAWFRQGQRTA
jgi:pimeloyl-ACP methyl ester carboxylesterase